MPSKETASPGPVRRMRHAVEYAFIRTLSALACVLPERAAVAAGRALGFGYWLIGASRRRVARENIEKSMPGELGPREVRRLVRRVFTHIGLTTVETLWMRSRVRRWKLAERFPIDGIEAVRGELAAGRGVIAFTPHLGNWELLGGAIAARLGHANALARPTNNPLVERYTTRLREALGMRVLSTREGVRPMVTVLRNAEFLGVLVDQHVNRAFVRAKFFGRPAATTAVVPSLALRLDIPCFAAYAVRDGCSFRHRGHFEGPIPLVRTGNREADVLAGAQRINDRLEQIIRRHPEQWLWTHRRWKLADSPEPDAGPETRLDPDHEKEQSLDA